MNFPTSLGTTALVHLAVMLLLPSRNRDAHAPHDSQATKPGIITWLTFKHGDSDYTVY